MTDTTNSSAGEKETDLPTVDRAWELMEMAYGDNEMKVMGWASSSLMSFGTAAGGSEGFGGITFSTFTEVQRSHEDEVLVIAIRVPHPDHMTLDEVLARAPQVASAPEPTIEVPLRTVLECHRGHVTPYDEAMVGQPCPACHPQVASAPEGGPM